MNALHSCETDQWGTPPEIIELADEVLGGIELDPCSSDVFNRTVGAERIFAMSALSRDWFARSILVNPPGGKQGGKSLPALFWEKLMQSAFGHAIWIGFSLEQLANTQRPAPRSNMLDYPLCVPRKRISFVRPDGTRGKSPSHSNVIVYVPGWIDETERFKREFSVLGAVR